MENEGLRDRWLSFLRERRISGIAHKMNCKPEDALVVFTNGRGGGTWLAEILRHIPESAVVWEPLQLRGPNPFIDIGFQWHQHIPQDANWPEALEEMRRLCAGKGLTWRNTFFERVNLSRYATAKRLVVKFVGGNGLAGWLVENIDFTCKPIVLLRHPMAIAASRNRHGAWNSLPNRYMFPEGRFMEFSAEKRKYLNSLRTRHEILIAKWCVQNVPLLQALEVYPEKFFAIYYEHLTLQRETEIERLFSEWSITVPEGVNEAINKPSRTTRAGSPLTGHDQLRFWRKGFDDREIASMQSVLDNFGVTLYSADNDMPNFRN